MASDAFGWVEIFDAEDGVWDGLILASHLLDRDYVVFGRLFGHRMARQMVPVAAGRGIPDDASLQVRAELEEWGTVVAPTWVTWQEIQAIDWEGHALPLGWRDLFDLCRVLARRGDAQQVRLVVWFDQ